ncbi:hypothetical protein F4781DRAFT_256584 [Annulohypoxylon bovei var. microspora]|nr:hypothetical protein F4781DRAFT_256584 [Annulohypoxylon bovei var. microspora]
MATPWIPRMHLWEIDDQPWFPSFLRNYVQVALTHAWTFHLPLLQPGSPAILVAAILRRVLGASVSRHTYIDFCAGAGGPTPFIERALNQQLSASSSSSSPAAPSYAAVANPKTKSAAAVDFVLTDLHPNVESWEAASRQSKHLSYVARPVDASAAPAELLHQYANKDGKGIFRLFNLAFHHFDDKLARAILKNTLETSEGFGIFELQERSACGFLTCLLFGVLILLIAPFLYWWAPLRLVFVYALPVVPFVLVFDGIVSALRTRTPDEVEALLRTCGADCDGWEMKSGRERFLWPTGYLNWVICTKKAI